MVRSAAVGIVYVACILGSYFVASLGVQETVQEAKADVLEKAEEFEEKAEETAKDLRVPVPQTRLPFVGPVGSLALKQVCHTRYNTNSLRVSRLNDSGLCL